MTPSPDYKIGCTGDWHASESGVTDNQGRVPFENLYRTIQESFAAYAQQGINLVVLNGDTVCAEAIDYMKSTYEVVDAQGNRYDITQEILTCSLYASILENHQEMSLYWNLGNHEDVTEAKNVYEALRKAYGERMMSTFDQHKLSLSGKGNKHIADLVFAPGHNMGPPKINYCHMGDLPMFRDKTGQPVTKTGYHEVLAGRPQQGQPPQTVHRYFFNTQDLTQLIDKPAATVFISHTPAGCGLRDEGIPQSKAYNNCYDVTAARSRLKENLSDDPNAPAYLKKGYAFNDADVRDNQRQSECLQTEKAQSVKAQIAQNPEALAQLEQQYIKLIQQQNEIPDAQVGQLKEQIEQAKKANPEGFKNQIIDTFLPQLIFDQGHQKTNMGDVSLSAYTKDVKFRIAGHFHHFNGTSRTGEQREQNTIHNDFDLNHGPAGMSIINIFKQKDGSIKCSYDMLNQNKQVASKAA